ncbi:TPA: hypothetical protein I9Y74_003810, partial [Elizabethkingia anophelis]|nr:hypothetical protein [Elizabethkingia anophelis]
ILGDGIHGTPKYDEDGEYFFINGNNLDDGNILIKPSTKTVGLSEYNKYQKPLNSKSVFVSINGTLGNVAFFNSEKIILGKSACYFNICGDINLPFIKAIIDSNYFKIYANNNATGSTIKNLSLLAMRELFIPLPSPLEQQRITSALEQYSKLINGLEKNKENLEKFILQAKSKILDLAIRGKLVPQDPNDEPASVLLERIKSEHPESKKKAKNTGDNSHYPFDIPKSWEWSTIGEISQHNTGKTLHKGRNSGTPYKYITTSNLYWDSFVLDNLKEMPFEEKELDKFSAIKGDLLICEGGDGGRSAIWTEEYTICFQNHIHRVRPFCDIKSKYIYFFMLYSSLKGSINDYKKGIGIQSLSSSSLASIKLSLPPIEEQKRIVKKIEDIFFSLNEIANSIKA